MPQEGDAGAVLHPPHAPFRLVFTPSVPPLWYARVTAACTASLSRSRPRVKACRWGRSVVRTAAIYSARRPGLPWRGVQAADLFSREASIIFQFDWLETGPGEGPGTIEYADASDLFHVWLKRVLLDIEPDLFGPEAVRTKDGLQNKNDEIMVCRVHEPGRRTPPSRWSRPRRTSAVPSSRRSADPNPTKSSTATAKPLPSRRSMPGSVYPSPADQRPEPLSRGVRRARTSKTPPLLLIPGAFMAAGSMKSWVSAFAG